MRSSDRAARGVLFGALLACCALAPATGAAAAARLSFTGSTHAPRANAPFTLTARSQGSGRPLEGRVVVDVLFGGKKVGHIHTGRLNRGLYRHTIRWPERSVGYPLTLRARVRSRGRTHEFTYAVRVRR